MPPQPGDSSSFFVVPKADRLRWLIYLRWLALSAVAAGLLLAWWLRFPWVALRPVAVALACGVLYNLAFFSRQKRLTPSLDSELAAIDRELARHVLADVGALTILLLASGGLRNPICMFYGFHVVLGAMLGDRGGAILAAGVATVGIATLVAAEHLGLLFSAPLLSPPLWLCGIVAVLAILSLAYFSLSVLGFVEREQGRALHNYQLLLSALDRLQVGLQLVGVDGRLLLSNPRATQIHPCLSGRFSLPAALALSLGKTALPSGVPHRFAHTQAGESQIIEILQLGGDTPHAPRAYLYADRTEAAVDEQRAMMLERLASLGRVMQEVAHELNTPLASIQTLAVDLSHAIHSPDAAESVSLIVDEARRCQSISRELLATARPGPPSPVSTVLFEVIKRARRLVYGRRRDTVTLHGDPLLACVTDADRLLQVLVNLLQNASDASDNPVVVTVSSPAPRIVEITVLDHGPGLTPEVEQKLFVPFVSTKPPGQGTGLGLYTCARLAQALHAELQIRNHPGAGVCASLRLPTDTLSSSPDLSTVSAASPPTPQT